MKKINIVRSNIDFNNIINTGKVFKNKYFVIYVSIEKNKTYRFGISVPKKIGNAVTRNKIKRQIKSILDNNIDAFLPLDYIIIARRMILDIEYSEKTKNLIDILNKINKEINNE
jgi:ribonuclease P protein component